MLLWLVVMGPAREGTAGFSNGLVEQGWKRKDTMKIIVEFADAYVGRWATACGK